MIEGRSDSEKGSWLFEPRVFFPSQFEFFSSGLWFCSEYFVVPTTPSTGSHSASASLVHRTHQFLGELGGFPHQELGSWHHVNTPQAGAGTNFNVG
jgi:hypothetical protein